MKILLNIILFGIFVLHVNTFAKTKIINFCHSALTDTTNLTLTETFIAY